VASDWRDEFLYVYYWEKNFPQSPTVFALRGDRFKYITYYGLWDCDELYDLQADPGETVNLIDDPHHAPIAKKMENRLYAILGEKGGMYIPLNQPMGGSANKRLQGRNGNTSADFPPSMVVPEPLSKGAQ
jgi:N-acetylglucosamine-6-sulfatase